MKKFLLVFLGIHMHGVAIKQVGRHIPGNVLSAMVRELQRFTVAFKPAVAEYFKDCPCCKDNLPLLIECAALAYERKQENSMPVLK